MKKVMGIPAMRKKDFEPYVEYHDGFMISMAGRKVGLFEEKDGWSATDMEHGMYYANKAKSLDELLATLTSKEEEYKKTPRRTHERAKERFNRILGLSE